MDVPATFFQYDHYCEDVGKDKREDENSGRNDRPVIRVSYWDAVDFANWVTQKRTVCRPRPKGNTHAV
jgi:sulfatase modifying factor 1